MADTGAEWNQVKRKGRKLRHVSKPVADEKAPSDNLQPNPNPEYSIGDLSKYHDGVTRKFEQSACWRKLEKLLDSALSSRQQLPRIARAVCLGTGPYDPADGSSQARWTAHMQTAAFCAIINTIRSKTNQEIKCFIQEPRFTQIDKEFCSKLDLEAVDSPGGFDLVDENTLLYAIHVELEICNLAMRKSLPTVFIGTGLDEWLRVVDGTKERPGHLHRFFKLEDNYHKLPFPDLDYIFSSTSIYLREDQQTHDGCERGHIEEAGKEEVGQQDTEKKGDEKTESKTKSQSLEDQDAATKSDIDSLRLDKLVT
ncbi:uncharacterized protein PODANS_1_16090 [Podospora anserina S mat+]|uniref:Podospora anserina S mat+ genomic DNA chromosome 1, supercontig 4 n=1 Tax=Podospora anserina (strain S / ATCC MYA-4624 / DSM 980 / FGSC 10383) TaxID=515849 RepID=B2ATJ6_PODAN|nr:uncharacterized protein PODANS_1_16090 [Podospora anserina S mat+]CAP67719.1 unnamed protein product [Podospora anserina S mat+]CDP23977.1 Putative protein of unknown function [Podospora anserina S mat+]